MCIIHGINFCFWISFSVVLCSVAEWCLNALHASFTLRRFTYFSSPLFSFCAYHSFPFRRGTSSLTLLMTTEAVRTQHYFAALPPLRRHRACCRHPSSFFFTLLSFILSFSALALFYCAFSHIHSFTFVSEHSHRPHVLLGLQTCAQISCGQRILVSDKTA